MLTPKDWEKYGTHVIEPLLKISGIKASSPDIKVGPREIITQSTILGTVVSRQVLLLKVSYSFAPCW